MTDPPDSDAEDKVGKSLFSAFECLVGASGAQADPYLRFALLLTLAVVFTVVAFTFFGKQIDPGAQRLIGACVGGGFLLSILLLFRRPAQFTAGGQHGAPASVSAEPSLANTSSQFRQIVLITPAVSNCFDLIVSALSINAHRAHLNVTVKVPNARYEAAAQNSLINSVCDDLVHGEVVVVIPAEPEAVRDDLSRLCSANRTIPALVALGVPLKPISGKKGVNLEFPFVGVDNRRGAELAADAFAAHFRLARIEQPSLYVLSGPTTVPQWRARTRAFVERFTEVYGDRCHIVTSEAAARWDRKIARELTQRHFDSGAQVDGIFACNDDLAIGARQAVLQWRRSGGPGPVRIIGFDGIDEMYDLSAQKDEVILATINVCIAEPIHFVMELVTARVDGKPQPFTQQLVKPKLVEWGTTERPQLPYDVEDAA